MKHMSYIHRLHHSDILSSLSSALFFTNVIVIYDMAPKIAYHLS